ncbi:hypothetical protein FB451DRAFT_1556069 [Mycena latifolia]|nr:hypothetical protein FB451DRAFT_1556069 [Mycena latifolia]
MANPFTINHFAAEILFEIASNTTSAEQISLSTVSRTFNSIAIKFMYRRIELTSFRRIVRCCTTLAKNSEAALSVRTLSFDLLGHTMISDRWNVTIFEPFFRMVNAALVKTPRLRSLILRLPYDPRGTTLQNCTFPLLSHYGASFDSGGDFVERHPMIKNITVLGEGFRRETTSAFHPAKFPSLNVFSGPAHLVPAVVPGRPVHSAQLWWPLYPCYDTDDGLDSWQSATVISSLAQSTSQAGLAALDNLFFGWPSIRVLRALGASLHLQVLFIRSSNCGEHAYREFLVELATILPQFQQLYELSVTFVCQVGGYVHFTGDQAAELVAEFWTIREWANRCPTLRVCTLQSFITWLRFRMTSPSFWIPMHPDVQIFGRVFVDTLRKEAFESRSAWDVFCKNCFALCDQLPRGSALFIAMHAQVVALQSVRELIPTSL